MQEQNTAPAVLRPKAAAQYLGIGLTTLWGKLNSNSPYFDESFPRPFKLHGQYGRAVGFLKSDLDNWLHQRKNNNHANHQY